MKRSCVFSFGLCFAFLFASAHAAVYVTRLSDGEEFYRETPASLSVTYVDGFTVQEGDAMALTLSFDCSTTVAGTELVYSGGAWVGATDAFVAEPGAPANSFTPPQSGEFRLCYAVSGGAGPELQTARSIFVRAFEVSSLTEQGGDLVGAPNEELRVRVQLASGSPQEGDEIHFRDSRSVVSPCLEQKLVEGARMRYDGAFWIQTEGRNNRFMLDMEGEFKICVRAVDATPYRFVVPFADEAVLILDTQTTEPPVSFFEALSVSAAVILTLCITVYLVKRFCVRNEQPYEVKEEFIELGQRVDEENSVPMRGRVHNDDDEDEDAEL